MTRRLGRLGKWLGPILRTSLKVVAFNLTSYSWTYVDNLDYIFFKERSRLVVRKLLMLPPDEIVFAETALPNHDYVSDHVALVTEFAYLDQPFTRKL